MAAFTKAERHRHYLSVTASIIGMLIVIAPVTWVLVRPVLVSSVSTAMAEDISNTIDEKLAPLTGGFVAIITQNINRLRREITTLEYKRMNDTENWSSLDAQNLTNNLIDLDGQVSALAALQ